MNARLAARLLSYSIDDATLKATGERLTPSRRYRRWKAIAARLAVCGVVVGVWVALR